MACKINLLYNRFLLIWKINKIITSTGHGQFLSPFCFFFIFKASRNTTFFCLEQVINYRSAKWKMTCFSVSLYVVINFWRCVFLVIFFFFYFVTQAPIKEEDEEEKKKTRSWLYAHTHFHAGFEPAGWKFKKKKPFDFYPKIASPTFRNADGRGNKWTWGTPEYFPFLYG